MLLHNLFKEINDIYSTRRNGFSSSLCFVFFANSFADKSTHDFILLHFVHELNCKFNTFDIFNQNEQSMLQRKVLEKTYISVS